MKIKKLEWGEPEKFYGGLCYTGKYYIFSFKYFENVDEGGVKTSYICFFVGDLVVSRFNDNALTLKAARFKCDRFFEQMIGDCLEA